MSPLNPKTQKILERIKLVFETIGAALSVILPLLKFVGVGAASFAVATYLGDIKKSATEKGYTQQVAQYEESKAVALRQMDSTKATVRRLNQTIADKDKKIADLQSRTRVNAVLASRAKADAAQLEQQLKDTTKTLRDSVDIYKELLPKKDEVILQQHSMISTMTTTITELQSINAMNKTVKDQSLATIDSLVTVINNTPKPPKNKDTFLWFIPKPNRVVSFLGGVALTSLAVAAAK